MFSFLQVFVFIKVGSGRVNSCTLKKSSTDRGMHGTHISINFNLFVKV